MKKILIATTALVATAGVAAADVSFSGAAKMGVKKVTGSDIAEVSDTTLSVAMSGETDGGLSFGTGFDITAGALDNGVIDDAAVWISGGFGKLSMGDADNAIDAQVGGLADIGLTGLGVDDVAENGVGASAFDALYTGTFGGVSVALSMELGGENDYAVAAGYSMGGIAINAGIEEVNGKSGSAASASGSFGGISLAALYGKQDGSEATMGVTAGYTMGAITVTAGYAKNDDNIGAEGISAVGVGAAYNLGGGASVKAGFAEIEAAGGAKTKKADLGISMSF